MPMDENNLNSGGDWQDPDDAPDLSTPNGKPYLTRSRFKGLGWWRHFRMLAGAKKSQNHLTIPIFRPNLCSEIYRSGAVRTIILVVMGRQERGGF